MERSIQEIVLHGSSLEPGETTRVECVTCHGGSPTLTITRKDDGAIVWNCYRASCEDRGARGGQGGVFRAAAKERTMPTSHPYDKPLRPLSDDEYALLRAKIGWDDWHCVASGVRYAPEDDRFAMPIYGPTGRRRGYVLRDYTGLVRTKTLTRMENDEPHISWYRHKPGRTTVIVEDIPSAVRAAAYVNAVALCGTGCGPEYALEIASHAHSVVWCLDADATELAMRWQRKYSMMFQSSSVRPLEKDMKDMTEAELSNFMEGLV